jgi:hypothetical protein
MGLRAIGEPQAFGKCWYGQRIGVEARQIVQQLDRPDPGPGSGTLWHEPDPPGKLPRGGGQAQHVDRSSGRRNQTGAAADQRCLACTVGAQDGSECPSSCFQRKPVENRAAAESHDQVGYPNGAVGLGTDEFWTG